MHPEISLVLLTVLAGAGQGIFILLVALNSLFYGTGAVPSEYIVAAGAISLLFQVGGIITSTAHLGNPHRGWRAMLMIKNSWLSREVVTLSLSVGITALYLLLYYSGATGTVLFVTGMVGIAANLGFYLSCSMVYASVTFIREWSNAFTPLNFTLFGITSGFGVNLAIAHYTHVNTDILFGINSLTLALALVALIMKLLSYRFNATAYVSVNVKNAIGVNDPNIKLMDMGASYDHYNTKEYFYENAEKITRKTMFLVLTVAFLVPIILWTVAALKREMAYIPELTVIAAIAMIAGLIIERRFFFIQGNNVQNLYYANFRSTGVRNPLESRARKGTPVPMN